MKKYTAYIIVAAVSLMLLTGCSEKQAPFESSAETEEKKEEAEKSAKMEKVTEESAETEGDGLTEKESEQEETFSSSAVISPEGEEIAWAIYSEGVYCYSNGSLWGYLSEDGEEITPCIYEEAAPFSGGLACVRLNGKYGYIGKNGAEVIPFRYTQAASFREGAAFFACGEEYGLMNPKGDVILELTGSDYDSISSFREGLACFSVDGLYGYMDKSGKIVMEPVYGDAGYFCEGLAEVMKDGFLGVIGKDGREVLSPEYSDIRIGETGIIAQKGDIFYCFDKEGKEIFSGVWDNVEEADGVFYLEKDGKKGLADESGNVILEPDYRSLKKVPEKELIIAVNGMEEYGVVDYEGNIKVPFLYQYIGAEEGGLTITVREGDSRKEGLLDKDDFSVKIPPVYELLMDFTGGKAVARANGKYGVVRYDGTLVLPIEYDAVDLFSDGAMFVRKEEESKLINSEGTEILCGDYDRIWDRGDGYHIELSYGEWQYADRQGTVLACGEGSSDYVYGAENSYILADGSLLRTGEEKGQTAETYLLSNQLTPRAGLFNEFLKTGQVYPDASGPGMTAEIAKLLQNGRGFYKLYRVGDEEDIMLYLFIRPWERSDYPRSDSGLFIIQDGQVVQVSGAHDSGNSGTVRSGAEACLWRDTEKGGFMPGIKGYSSLQNRYVFFGDIYCQKKGEKARSTDISFWRSSTLGYGEEEDEYEYNVNDEYVSEEEYDKVMKRYRCYIPAEHAGIR